MQKTPVAYDKASAVTRLLHAAVISLILLSMATAQKSSEVAVTRKVREQVTWHPPDFPVIAKGQSWTKPKPMVTSLRTDGLSIELEQTEIQAISKRYHTALGQEGDAGEFFEWLCFVGGRKEQRWAMWLGSGEIDGGRVSDFLIKQIPSDADVDSRCGVLPATIAEPTTSPDELRLGMSEAELTSVLGKPTANRHDFVFYAHKHDLNFRNEPYTMMNTVTAQVKDGMVTAIRVWKSTTS